MMLVNKSWAPTFEEIALPTRMGRSLLVSQFAHPSLGGDPALVHAVATVHLESLNSERARAEQLDICRAHLRPFSNAVLCGDFNFDSTQTWGDWRPGARPRPAAELENHVLARALPDFVDVWPLLRPEDAGITFDGASNPCVHDRAERMRYDRIVLKQPARVAAASPGSLLRPVAIEMSAEPLAGKRALGHFGFSRPSSSLIAARPRAVALPRKRSRERSLLLCTWCADIEGSTSIGRGVFGSGVDVYVCFSYFGCRSGGTLQVRLVVSNPATSNEPAD